MQAGKDGKVVTVPGFEKYSDWNEPMDIQELSEILKKHNILETAALINPSFCPDGALCLMKDHKEGSWRILYNEKGTFYINEFFCAQHDACRYFLRHILTHPEYRKDYKTKKFSVLEEESKKLLDLYGFDNSK